MRSATVQLVILATVVALGACNDGAGEATSTPDETAATPEARVSSPASESAAVSIEAEAHEWDYTPDAWTVTAGEEFTIEFVNDGGVEHDWTVLALDSDIATLDEFEDGMVLVAIEDVPRQESTTEAFTIDEPGTYQVICTISGHFNTGMDGTLTVE